MPRIDTRWSMKGVFGSAVYRGYYRAEAYALGGSACCAEAYVLGGVVGVVTLGPSSAKACQGCTHRRVSIARLSRG